MGAFRRLFRPRRPGTDVHGRSFPNALRDEVWFRARSAYGLPSDDFRHDALGNVMRFRAFGDTSDPHGWEIDHIRPLDRGGTDDLDNLQALHWRANRTKGDAWPWEPPQTLQGMEGERCEVDSPVAVPSPPAPPNPGAADDGDRT